MEFTEIAPDASCGCGDCAARRSPRPRPTPHRARRAAVLMAAVSTVLGAAATAGAAPRAGGTSSPADTDTPQGEVSPLFGGRTLTPHTRGAAAATTRGEIMARAQRWVDQQVPYSMSSYWSDGYRQDCSGYVSMAWGLGSSQTTWTLPDFADRIAPADLQPGDILVYNNSDNPQGGSHTVLFGGWQDSAHTRYLAYEQTRPTTRRRATPYAYWSHADSYVPYRYRGLAAGTADLFPGTDAFGPGRTNDYVKRLGEMLVQRGAARFYGEGPDPSWGEADRRATEAFQRAQGWQGSEADGYPGKDTWNLLVTGHGHDIPPTPAPPPPASAAPPFPGTAAFGPGQSNDSVKQLGEQLVRKGFGRHYTEGPGPTWSESDRLNVADFQHSLGWQGTEADGYPGPDTWRKLFT
ncbi:peptidoglycan-binding protein [Kitasatospora sp. MMS16-BH015]|uniref:peptidoglycan-binding protein n=1 Tax=Kitasatospora sp. MMS16-BH015 TaxID=2018025 RepID=UPI000CF2AFE5|nr:peptidoglycan-binding protein [Kitasatospora sp. MMS16-BH015]